MSDILLMMIFNALRCVFNKVTLLVVIPLHVNDRNLICFELPLAREV